MSYDFQIEVLDPLQWKGYQLLDSGDGQKLEQFGPYVISRPEPQAIWDKGLSNKEWENLAHASFTRDKQNPEKGQWLINNMPSKWEITLSHPLLAVKMKLSLTSFKHVGVFPEQALNWLYIQNWIKKLDSETSLLNLFAYTGGASVVAAMCGAQVTHVDSVKNVITWGNENARLNSISSIRWVVEDALKFTKREVQRGKKYQGIILDPPAYGRGPDGEKWVLEEHLNELLKKVYELLDKKGFILLNLYSMGLSPIIAQTILQKISQKKDEISIGEFVIPDARGFFLPLGTFVRLEKQ